MEIMQQVNSDKVGAQELCVYLLGVVIVVSTRAATILCFAVLILLHQMYCDKLIYCSISQ